VAIYISPISKTEKDHPQHFAYYKIKELLLNKGISSQVLYKEHLSKEDFYYFIPNIYVALLAKIGGIPWRLARVKEDEIIIGVGAFKPQGSAHRFVGSAFVSVMKEYLKTSTVLEKMKPIYWQDQ
jgi:hypothetical protein